MALAPQVSNNILPSVPLWFIVTLIFVSAVGFLDAVYLSVTKIYAGATPCTVLEGCEVVTSSVYSMVFGIPVAVFGVVFYLAVLLLTLWYWDTKQSWALSLIAGLGILAFIASLVFVGIQAFILKAFCLYCLVSALTSTIIFILGLSYIILFRR